MKASCNALDTEGEAPEISHSLLDIVSDDFEISRGMPLPLGATLLLDGINFAVFSSNASLIRLVLYEPGADYPIAEFPLDPRFNRTGDIWHVLVRGIPTSIEYGYRVDRDNNVEKHIHRFDCRRC